MMQYFIDLFFGTFYIFLGMVGLASWVVGVAFAVLFIEITISIVVWFVCGKQIKIQYIH